MHVIAWLIKILIFIALLGFALGNTETVRLGIFGSQDIGFNAPLVVFLLLFFGLGVLVGLLTVTPRLLRQRHQIARMGHELEMLQQRADLNDANDLAAISSSSHRLPSA